MSDDKQGPMENLLDGLNHHAGFLNREERKAELRGRGIDVDQFLTDAHLLIASCQKEERLAWMKVADEKRNSVANAESQISNWLGKSAESIRAAFENLVQTVSPTPAHTLAFRNRKDLTTDDMASILNDYERLKLRGQNIDSFKDK
jgi:hypothetical protein